MLFLRNSNRITHSYVYVVAIKVISNHVIRTHLVSFETKHKIKFEKEKLTKSKELTQTKYILIYAYIVYDI